jgi:hypothetical protein
MTEDMRIRTFGRRTNDVPEKRKCFVMDLSDISVHSNVRLEAPLDISHVSVRFVLS